MLHCDACHKAPGTIKILDLVDGKLAAEKKLCNSCAENAGYVHHKNPQINLPPEVLTELFGTMPPGSVVKSGPPPRETDLVCPACGLTGSQFRARGRLGCPRCYDVFRKALLPLLERVHDASSHRGRCPGRTAGMAGVDDKLADLRSSLRDAISAENYELAASIRDQIRTLTGRADDQEPAT